MTLSPLIGLVVGLAFGGALVALVAAWRGWRPHRRTGPRRGATSLWRHPARRRAGIALAAALLVAVVTRWPVAALATGVLIWLWPTMFGGRRDSTRRVEQVDALATWTESLRDSIAGQVGLEQAIQHSLTTAPAVLVPGLQRLEGRLHAHVPLTQALAAFGEDLDDASADLVVGALILNSQLRGPGLKDTLTSLARSARDELDLQRHVEQRRKSLRRAATTIVVVTGLFGGGITLFSRQYVEPYSTPLGQVVLGVVLAVFTIGLVWIRQAGAAKAPARFLVGADDVSAALIGRNTP